MPSVAVSPRAKRCNDKGSLRPGILLTNCDLLLWYLGWGLWTRHPQARATRAVQNGQNSKIPLDRPDLKVANSRNLIQEGGTCGWVPTLTRLPCKSTIFHTNLVQPRPINALFSLSTRLAYKSTSFHTNSICARPTRNSPFMRHPCTMIKLFSKSSLRVKPPVKPVKKLSNTRRPREVSRKLNLDHLLVSPSSY